MEASQWDSGELEAAIAGAPGADPMLVAFVAAVRRAADRSVHPSIQTRHISAAAAAAVHATAPPSPTTTVGVRWRRRLSLAGLTSGLAIKMMLGTAALAAVGGSAAAATGNLPAPVQAAVSEAAGHLGISLPDPAPAAPATVALDEDDAPAGPTNDERNAVSPADEAPSADDTTQADVDRARAAAYTVAVKEWTACVREAARTSPPGERFSPTAACGDHPDPHDFGLPGADPKDKDPKDPKVKDPKDPKVKDPKDPNDPKDPKDKDPKAPKDPKDKDPKAPKDPKDK